MKKPIIISGKQGSGKSVIANAIVAQHDYRGIKEISRHDIIIIQKHHTIIIFDEIYKNEIDDIIDICQSQRDIQIIINTQDHILQADINHESLIIYC